MDNQQSASIPTQRSYGSYKDFIADVERVLSTAHCTNPVNSL
jgi:hypothetical protein